MLRGFAASSVAIFTALAGHVSSGGLMPGMLGIAVPWVLSFMVCVLLSGRRLSVVRLSASVMVSQFLFHVLFVLGAITPTVAMTGHQHGTHIMMSDSSGVVEAIAAGGMMWFGHALAALITIVALHRGERLLLGLRDLAQRSIRWLRRRVDVVTARPALPSPPVAPTFTVTVLRSALLLAPLRGRAPPLLAAV